MENIQNLGEQNYVAAKCEGHSKLRNFLVMLKIFINSVFCLFYGFFLYFWNYLFNVGQPKNLSGKVALVTGGGNGLGREICLRLAEEKCHVAVVDVDAKGAENTAADVRAMGVNANAYEVDVSNYHQIATLREKIIRDLGYVDILINNAALVPLISFREGTPEDIERIMNVNLVAHFWTTRVFLKDMYDRKAGHIVAISSLLGLFGFARTVAYCATKFGIRGFMDSLYEDIANNKMSDNIHITSVYPCVMATRQEVVDLFTNLNMFNRTLVVSPKFAADVTVNAIKNKQISVSVPPGLITFAIFLTMMPRVIRDKLSKLITGGNLPEIHPDGIKGTYN